MTAPERIWMGAPNDDCEVEVWFDPDEGGTCYVRADLYATLAARVRSLEEALEWAKECIEALGGRSEVVQRALSTSEEGKT